MPRGVAVAEHGDGAAVVRAGEVFVGLPGEKVRHTDGAVRAPAFPDTVNRGE